MIFPCGKIYLNLNLKEFDHLKKGFLQSLEVFKRLSNIKEGLFGKKITEKSFESFAKNIIGML